MACSSPSFVIHATRDELIPLSVTPCSHQVGDCPGSPIPIFEKDTPGKETDVGVYLNTSLSSITLQFTRQNFAELAQRCSEIDVPLPSDDFTIQVKHSVMQVIDVTNGATPPPVDCTSDAR